jgi:hypothetical protein
VSDSGESDIHAPIFISCVSDSGESDNWNALFAVCMTDSAESDNCGSLFVVWLSDSPESDTLARTVAAGASSVCAISDLYWAVNCDEHCSMEMCGGYTIPSQEAHCGSFLRAICHPAIWSSADGRSSLSTRLAFNASSRTSSLRCIATNSRVSSFMIVIGDVPDFVVLIRRHSGDFLVSHDVDKLWIIVDECG